MHREWMKKTQKPKHHLISLFRGIYPSSYMQIQDELVDLCSILSFGVPIRSKIVGYGDWASVGQRLSQWGTVRCVVDGHFSWKGRRGVDLTYLGWEDALLGISFASWAPPKQASPSFSLFSNMKTTCICDPKSGVAIYDLEGRPFLSL